MWRTRTGRSILDRYVVVREPVGDDFGGEVVDEGAACLLRRGEGAEGELERAK